MGDIVDVPLGIKEGDIFATLEDVEKTLKDVTKLNYVQFYKRESRTIAAAAQKTKRYMDPRLKYYQVAWACVHGGRKYKCRGKGIRQTNTLKHKQLCPAQVRIKVSSSGDDFVVVAVNNKHNHKVCKNLFESLPRQKKLPGKIKESAKKKLGDKLQEKLIKKKTLKDLTNLQSQNKLENNNNIREACEKINSKFDANSHLLNDVNNVFKGVMFSTKAMKTAMAAYPEILCIDATFTLSSIQAHVFLILNEDGNGESVVVAVGILVSKDEESLRCFLNNFKMENSKWTRTRTIMADKELVGRSVITECFPKARLKICIFHALKIFRTVITEKFQITEKEKKTVLEYLQKLVYTKKYGVFLKTIKDMKSEIPGELFQYLDNNWLNIKDEWHLGAQHNNFLSTTNSIIECIKSKLKQVIIMHSSIGEFLEKLFTTLKSLEDEQNKRLANSLNKRPTILPESDSAEYKYQQLMTPYSFLKMKKQFAEMRLFKVSVIIDETFLCYYSPSSTSDTSNTISEFCTTIKTCPCCFYESMRLPCRHIFAVRQHVGEDLYDENLIPERWKKQYLMRNNSFLKDINVSSNKCDEDQSINNIAVETFNCKPRKVLSEQEKCTLLVSKCKMAASLGAKAQGSNFIRVVGLFDNIAKMLQSNIYDFQFTYANNDATEGFRSTEELHLGRECVISDEMEIEEPNKYQNSDCDEDIPNTTNCNKETTIVNRETDIEELHLGREFVISNEMEYLQKLACDEETQTESPM